MMLIANYVAPSTIHGTGLFTKNPIPKGTLVWKHEHSFDRFFTHHEIKSFPPNTQEYLRIYAWSSRTNPHGVYYDMDNGRFMNHNPDPNLLPPEDGNDFELYATQNIPAGAELTCDYRKFEPNFVFSVV